MVNVFYEDTKTLDKTPEFFDLWFGKICHTEGKLLGDVSVVFCSDTYLLELNKRHLQHDFFTDIITFDYSENKTISAEVYISKDMMIENAKENSQIPENECLRLVSHALFHCMGYKDKSPNEKKTMRLKEEEFISAVSRETKLDV